MPAIDTQSALVCRGGSCTADRFAKGSGVTIDNSGRLNGVSVNSSPAADLRELTLTIPNRQVGVATVGAIETIGGIVIQSTSPNNPYHCVLSGITPQQAQALFTLTVQNPNAP